VSRRYLRDQPELTDAGEDIFRWIALAASWNNISTVPPQDTFPLRHLRCTSESLLMRRPELVYKYLDVGPPFHDVLLIPLTEASSQLRGSSCGQGNGRQSTR
jgi:hypothetical protein